jgi:hypothetical protein
MEETAEAMEVETEANLKKGFSRVDPCVSAVNEWPSAYRTAAWFLACVEGSIRLASSKFEGS